MSHQELSAARVCKQFLIGQPLTANGGGNIYYLNQGRNFTEFSIRDVETSSGYCRHSKPESSCNAEKYAEAEGAREPVPGATLLACESPGANVQCSLLTSIILEAMQKDRFGNYNTNRYQHAPTNDRQAPAMQDKTPIYPK